MTVTLGRCICVLALLAHASAGFSPSRLVELLLWLACFIYSYEETLRTSRRE